ncbi:MAG: hypothetical protein JW787_00505 [Sedimentisphaerales bacterium]|nr:hypothetical protein [Sedimentisphaerales bacterium]
MKKIVLIILLLLNISCTSPEPVILFPADAFLKESYEARSFLKRSFSSLPEGANLKTPADAVNVLDVNWPGDALTASVAENQPWRRHSHYHFILDLSNTELAAYKENVSSAMTASVLLDFYFSRLTRLDFKIAGENHTFLSHPIQFAGNTWFKNNCNIVITGSVYINVEYKDAFITADISEIYEQ